MNRDVVTTARRASAELFSSRWGVLMTALGIAVGTGNIWRFPRVAAANGGGVFIILWMLFLFLWSIPLLCTESALGRASRRGTVGSFTFLAGERAAWMGGFVALITAGIMFYYSVVTGWCLRYLCSAVLGSVNSSTGIEYWHAFAGSWEAAGFHALSALSAGLIVGAGIRFGIESTARVIIPSLFLILIYTAARSLSLPGSSAGVAHLFSFNPADFTRPKVYLEALSQSAWSTGAGWGLLLTYSVYSRPREKVVSNSLIMGLSDNVAALLAALAVIPTVFAMFPAAEAAELSRSAGVNSTGLTFIWIPRLLGAGPGGWLLLSLFFLALFLAALSSLISMIEMCVKNLIDMGLSRITATAAVTGATVLAGLPSALVSGFFDNQDWVWGLGLLVNGLFISLTVGRFGARRFREEVINIEGTGDFRLGRFYDPLIRLLIPLQFAALIGWWFWLSVGWNPERWWDPLAVFSIGSCLAQWGLAAALMLWLGPRLARRIAARESAGTSNGAPSR